jgi:hypothetical protein
MSLSSDLLPAAIACAWFSLLAIPFAAIPPGLLAVVLKTSDKGWIVPLGDEGAVRKIPYVRLGMAGGISGACAAVCSLFLATEWSCFKGQQLCHDGQTGMVLMLTVPLFAVLGATFALIWTRVTLMFPAENILASTFRYSGQKRMINRVSGLAILIGLWSVSVLLASLPLLHM